MFKVKNQQIKLIYESIKFYKHHPKMQNDPTTNSDVHRNQNYVLLLSV